MRRMVNVIALLFVGGIGWGHAQQGPLTFAPTSAKGILRATITVTGSGGEGYRSGGYDSLRWTARHTLSYETTLYAFEPMADTSSGNAAAMASAESAVREVFDEDAEAVQAKWDEKMDACDGNEACEMRVTGAMMADPAYRQLVLKLQSKGAGIMAKASAVNFNARYQLWGYRAGSDLPLPSYQGTASLERHQRRWGLVSTDGSGKSNDEARWARDGALPAGISPNRDGHLAVDAETGTYRLEIPAEFVLPVVLCAAPTGKCEPADDSTKVRLLEGELPEQFATVVTATGKVTDPAKPAASGTVSFEPVLHDGKVKVTIEWSFKLGGNP